MSDITKGKKDEGNACIGMRLPPEYYGQEGIEHIKAQWNAEDNRARVLHDKMEETINRLKAMVSDSGTSGKIPDIVQVGFLDPSEGVKVSQDVGNAKDTKELLRREFTAN